MCRETTPPWRCAIWKKIVPASIGGAVQVRYWVLEQGLVNIAVTEAKRMIPLPLVIPSPEASWQADIQQVPESDRMKHFCCWIPFCHSFQSTGGCQVKRRQSTDKNAQPWYENASPGRSLFCWGCKQVAHGSLWLVKPGPFLSCYFHKAKQKVSPWAAGK